MPPPALALSERVDLVLHIGSGKTGTSSIQALMHRNRERLAERGFLYPRTPGNTRHVRLGLFIRSDAELKTQVNWRRAMIRTCGRPSAGEREAAHLPEEDLVVTEL